MQRRGNRCHRRKSPGRNTAVWPVVLTAAIVTVLALLAVFGQEALEFFRAKDTQNELKELYRGTDAGTILDLIAPRAGQILGFRKGNVRYMAI